PPAYCFRRMHHPGPESETQAMTSTFKRVQAWARARFIHGVLATICGLLMAAGAQAQSIRFPWSGYAHDPQHDAIASVASQPLNRILWQTPVDLNPQYSGSELLIHYGSPLITRSNTVIVPVKTGATGGFEVEALVG